jgi:hypothetical protein
MSEPKITIDAASWNRVVRERDEAREDATSLAERLTALELSSTADLATLERERDESRAMARVKLITPQKNTPVAEYFSSSSTPETDKFKIKFKTPCGEKHWVPVEHSERLERERDEAREALDEEMKFHHRTHAELVQTQCQMQDVIREREASLEAAK